MQLSSSDIACLFQNSLSPDGNVREEATRYLNKLVEQDYDSFLLSLFHCYLDNGIDLHVRMSVGLAIKNSLISRERKGPTQLLLNEKWIKAVQDTKKSLKSYALHSISIDNSSLATTTSQVLAAISYHELPSNDWPEVIPYLLELSSNSASSIVKRTCIETLGYIAELVSASCLIEYSNQFLTVIVANMASFKADLQLAGVSCKALINSMSFISSNFEREAERDCIMNTLLSLAAISLDTQDPKLIDLSCLAFEAIVKIIQYYYPFIEKYFLSEITLHLCSRSITSPHNVISLQALEIWSSLSEIEDDLRRDPRDDIECVLLTERCFPYICRPILERLSYPPDSSDIDQDEWVPQMAASTCLSLICSCIGGSILENKDIIDFVQRGMISPSWTQKEASLMAFGSLLEISQKDLLDKAVEDMLPLLIEILGIESRDMVLDSATWVLGKIFDYFHHVVPTQSLDDIVSRICRLLLTKNQDVVNNCSWALMNLAVQYGCEDDEDEMIQKYPSNPNPISPFIRDILSTLLKTVGRSDIDVASVSAAVFQCAHGIISIADLDNIVVVDEICQYAMNALQYNFGSSMASSVQQANVKMMCGYFLILQACFKKLGRSRLTSYMTSTTSINSALLTQYSSVVMDDAFSCVSILAHKLPACFSGVWEYYYITIEKLIRSDCDETTMALCLEFMDEIVQAVGDNVCEMKFHQLITEIPKRKLTPSLLCKTIQYIGDVALFAPSLFAECYPIIVSALSICSVELSRYLQLKGDEDSYELIATLSMQSISCIFQACSSENVKSSLMTCISHVVRLVECTLEYLEKPYNMKCLQSVLGVVGDVCSIFPPNQSSRLFEREIFYSIFNSSYYDQDEDVRKLRLWIKSMVA